MIIIPLLLALLGQDAQGLKNMRDLGGHKTSDGLTVRRGLVFRSGALNGLARKEMGDLGRLELKCVCDLRGAAERKSRPDWRPDGVEDAWFDVMADADREKLAALGKAMRDPKNAKPEDVIKAYSLVYRDLVTKPGARKAYGGLYRSIAEGNTPALMHCSSGKDRVGWGSAALLALLGVPRETIVKDYLTSNVAALDDHAYKQALEKFVTDGGDASIPPMIYGVKAEYLEAAFAEVEAQHGSIEKYFADALGVDEATQKKLKDALLEKK
jgi:protein-tyrosine phosphatase